MRLGITAHTERRSTESKSLVYRVVRFEGHRVTETYATTTDIEAAHEMAYGQTRREKLRPAYRLFEEALDAGYVPESKREAWRESFGLAMLLDCLELQEEISDGLREAV